MIEVGQTITISGYDYDAMKHCKREFVVLQIYPFFAVCRHKKAGYRECFTTYDLIQNGYVPRFKDVYDEPKAPNHVSTYLNNKLLQAGYAG